MHKDILRTAGSAKLSLTHGAAALNSLCGFLERCSVCSKPDINVLSFSFDSWTEAFHILLTRTENHKAKPMRRLLMTLTSLILKHPSDDVKTSLIAHVIFTATRAINRQEDYASIKVAMQVLENLLSRNIIEALQIVQNVKSQQLNLNEGCSTAHTLDASRIVDTVQNFTFSVLHWVQYPDCAPAVGRFLPAFFGSLRDVRSQGAPPDLTGVGSSLWISPVKKSLERRPGLLEVYENHILPNLFRQSPTDRKAFLDTLPFDDIQHGNNGKLTVTDTQLCLLVAKIDLGTKREATLDDSQHSARTVENIIEAESGKTNLLELSADKECVMVDAVRLGSNLVEHSLPAVRIAALSLLASSASTGFLSDEVLSCLQNCIPFFHIEVSAKARNEFIALMKKLCVRMRGTIVSVIRDHSDSIHPYLDLNPTSPSRRVMVQNHKKNDLRTGSHRPFDFQAWYIQFLVQELRPTASYQSHITALRILQSLLEDDLSYQAHLSKANKEYTKFLKKILPLRMLLRPLLDLILDPFDDVRQVADMLIKVLLSVYRCQTAPNLNGESDCDSQIIEKSFEIHDAGNMIRSALRKAESKSAETGRADHADGVGMIYNLLYGADSAASTLDHLTYQLEKEIELARRDLLLAVSTARLHGHLIALR